MGALLLNSHLNTTKFDLETPGSTKKDISIHFLDQILKNCTFQITILINDQFWGKNQPKFFNKGQ